MKPMIDSYRCGRIKINGQIFRFDVVIELGGRVRRRKKKLSSRLYGTSHRLSLDEAKDVFHKGAKRLLIGTGRYGNVVLSKKAGAYFSRKGCKVLLKPTKKAVVHWNRQEGDMVGLFHITC